MRIDILLIETIILFILTFIVCAFKLSSEESRYEEENF